MRICKRDSGASLFSLAACSSKIGIAHMLGLWFAQYVTDRRNTNNFFYRSVEKSIAMEKVLDFSICV
jgi:hypothetical protein